jgi:hypothetical protein
MFFLCSYFLLSVIIFSVKHSICEVTSVGNSMVYLSKTHHDIPSHGYYLNLYYSSIGVLLVVDLLCLFANLFTDFNLILTHVGFVNLVASLNVRVCGHSTFTSSP